MRSEPEKPNPESQPEELRSLLGDTSQAGMESELSDQEDEAKGSATGASAALGPPPKTDEARYHSARKWTSRSVDKHPAQRKETRKKTGVVLDIQPKGAARQKELPPMTPRRFEQETAPMDDWEEVAPAGDENAKPLEKTDPELKDHVSSSQHVDAPVQAETDAKQEEEIPTEIHHSEGSESSDKSSSPVVKPAAPMRLLEWAALTVLIVLIAAFAIGAYFWTIHRLPQKAPLWEQVSYPVKGKLVEIKNATSYWRAPVTEGPNKDPIRRGTSLIPIVELEIVGGPAAIRMIFRDDEGRGVGDPIIRSITTSGKFALAATAGFEDAGMHAAYRTQELEPWTVEVSEAASADLSGNDFSLILKMNLSSDLR